MTTSLERRGLLETCGCNLFRLPAEAVMIDFWLANARLLGDGGDHRVRYTIDGGEPKYIEKWEPIWIQGFPSGKHMVKLELVDKNGNAVENGGYNTTTREITVVR